MRLSTLASALCAICFSVSATAQATSITAGCRDGAGGLPLTTNGAPQLGNLGFGINYVAEGPTSFVYFILSSCAQPLLDWNVASEPCAASWANPPGSCPSVVGALLTLDGAVTSGNGATVTYALPIPDYGPLVTFTATNPICVQFVGVDFANAQCTGFSGGLQIQFQP